MNEADTLRTWDEMESYSRKLQVSSNLARA